MGKSPERGSCVKWSSRKFETQEGRCLQQPICNGQRHIFCEAVQVENLTLLVLPYLLKQD